MNDTAVYGQVLVNVPAPELVEGGYILPPKVVVKQLPMVKGRKVMYAEDADNLLETIDDNNIDKTLICARTTKQIMGLISDSDFCVELYQRGYSWMTITSKTGAIIDGQKVNREQFFDTLNAWGKDPDKKFVVIHHSILSEGINVSVDWKQSSSCVIWTTLVSVSLSVVSFDWEVQRRLSVLFVFLPTIVLASALPAKFRQLLMSCSIKVNQLISEVRK